MLKAKFLSFDSLLNGDSKHTIIYTLSSKINKKSCPKGNHGSNSIS